jgi:Uma2 family endonuclease
MATVRHPGEAPAVAEPRLAMSYEAFLAWADEDVHAEWVNGEVIVFMPASDRHQVVAGLFYTLVALFVRAFGLGEVRIAPLEMRARPGGAAREPDILFVAAAHRDRLTAQRLVGPADLVVEIVSPESATRDRVEKFYEYEEAGIPEYLMFDPRPGRERVDYYRLTDDGTYLAIVPDAEGRYHSSAIPGFWFKPAWFWEEPTPDPLFLLLEVAPEALAPVVAALEARKRAP